MRNCQAERLIAVTVVEREARLQQMRSCQAERLAAETAADEKLSSRETSCLECRREEHHA